MPDLDVDREKSQGADSQKEATPRGDGKQDENQSAETDEKKEQKTSQNGDEKNEKAGGNSNDEPSNRGQQDSGRNNDGDKGDKKDTHPPKKPFYKRPLVIVVGSIVALVGLFFLAAYIIHAWRTETTDDAFIDGRVVQMNPKAAGYVIKRLIDDNQFVHKGDLLLEIDPRDYQAALDQAKAAAAAAHARVQQSASQVKTNEAAVEAAKANVLALQATALVDLNNLARAKEGFRKGAVSKQDLDANVAASKSSNANVESARAKEREAEDQLSTSRFQLLTAKADAAQADAAVRSAELNLSYTRIIAPVDGRITHRTVEKGDYLQPGQALFAIVEPDLWVTANFKETQLTHMRIGQPVKVWVDAYPHRKLAAHVDSFQRGTGSRFTLLPPENATGNYVKVVQRVPVKIVFDEPPPEDMILGPGMSVEPEVRVR